MSSIAPLPISRLVNVAVSLATAVPESESTSTMLVLGSSPVIDTKTRYRIYDTLEEVGLDFSDTDPEWLAAEAWFLQLPQPQSLLIGRWAQSATAGQLFGAPLTPTQQAALVTALQAISTGSMTISINGTSHNVTGLDFSAIMNLNGAAAVVQTALNALVAGTTCVWDSNYGYFIITSGTTGAGSTISFASVEGTGVDISAPLMLQSTDSGAYVVAGIVAETALAAVQLFDTQFGTKWYGLFICGAADADHEAVAAYIQAASVYHFYGVNTQEAAVLLSSSTTDIAYILAQLAYTRTCVQYSSSSPYAVVSLLGRILTTDYTANNSVITLMYRQEPGILAEFLTLSQISALEAKNANVFVAYNNNTFIIEPGVTCAGPPSYVDVIMGVDAFVLAVQAAVYDALYGSPTKIPQTDAGMHIIATAIETVCQQFVADGLLAPGTWTGQGFGSLTTGGPIDKGYYVYQPPVALQPASQRSQRLSVPFQVAAKLAGAVQTVDIALTVNN